MYSAEEMYRQLMEKSSLDPEFRRKLTDDPRGVMQQEFGIEIPEDVDIHVHQSDMNTIHLSVPAAELAEEQLEAIAAGRCCCCW